MQLKITATRGHCNDAIELSTVLLILKEGLLEHHIRQQISLNGGRGWGGGGGGDSGYRRVKMIQMGL